MSRRLRLIATFVTVACAAAATIGAVARAAEAAPKKKAPRTLGKVPGAAWCGEDFEALAPDLCHVDGGTKDGRRTLVVFLHGAIAKDVTWQWTHEEALLRQAKASGFTAIFPRSPASAGGYVWPGENLDDAERDLATRIAWAKKTLESRNGHPFDDVFVMGFSSGAYFASTLALRGRLPVDGYAVFAGGSAMMPKGAEAVAKPVFVGVCADDPQTAAHSRAFGGTVASLGWPHRVDEQHVGHMFADVHVAHAAAWLRKMHEREAGLRDVSVTRP